MYRDREGREQGDGRGNEGEPKICQASLVTLEMFVFYATALTIASAMGNGFTAFVGFVCLFVCFMAEDGVLGSVCLCHSRSENNVWELCLSIRHARIEFKYQSLRPASSLII